jgi:hypothetical protein
MAAPVAVVFVAAGIAASAGALVRPVQSSLLPSLAAVPEELVASNVVTSLAEAVGTFIGPLAGGVLIVSGGAGRNRLGAFLLPSRRSPSPG